jgi:(1->4)-alpha-D-glucan 1-alpha-D-glucosylmutase
MPADWGRHAAQWQRRAVELVPEAAGTDPETAYLLWQTLVGAWPLTPDRAREYLTKAMREAKTRTSWLSPDAGYEATIVRVATLALTDARLRGSIEEFVRSIEPDAVVNSLGAKLAQLTMPGVPDVYQGCELTALSLVDPDNRRPVDFTRRHGLLAALDSHEKPENLEILQGLFARTDHGDSPRADFPDLARVDTAKLLVTSRALRLRREHPEWFAGGYVPLAASGEADRHAVAFARGRSVTVVTRLPRGLRRRGGWAGTVLPLPGAGDTGATWRDVLTGAVFGARPLLSDLTERLPVALLVPEAE